MQNTYNNPYILIYAKLLKAFIFQQIVLYTLSAIVRIYMKFPNKSDLHPLRSCQQEIKHKIYTFWF